MMERMMLPRQEIPILLPPSIRIRSHTLFGTRFKQTLYRIYLLLLLNVNFMDLELRKVYEV